MRIYLAARYSRADELRQYRADLEVAGHTVTSRWLEGNHDMPESTDPDERVRLGQRFALDDFADVGAAEIVVAFTEPPGAFTGRGRGGRHVELGLALAWRKRTVVVGYRENVFCCLPQVWFYPDWPSARATLCQLAVTS